MTKLYLSLVLIEVPDNTEDSLCFNWFNCVSVDRMRIKNKLLEIIYSDGTVKVFNEAESDQILQECGEVIYQCLAGDYDEYFDEREALLREE